MPKVESKIEQNIAVSVVLVSLAVSIGFSVVAVYNGAPGEEAGLIFGRIFVLCLFGITFGGVLVIGVLFLLGLALWLLWGALREAWFSISFLRKSAPIPWEGDSYAAPPIRKLSLTEYQELYERFPDGTDISWKRDWIEKIGLIERTPNWARDHAWDSYHRLRKENALPSMKVLEGPLGGGMTWETSYGRIIRAHPNQGNERIILLVGKKPDALYLLASWDVETGEPIKI
jgi:hypothetical protein